MTVGNLTISGPSNETWVFKIGTALTTGTPAR